MEYQDAIEIIKEHLETLKDHHEMYDEETYNQINFALEYMAIKALERCISKEPLVLKEFGTPYGREYYACPECQEYIKYRYTMGESDNPFVCGWCGQALEWEEV